MAFTSDMFVTPKQYYNHWPSNSYGLSVKVNTNESKSDDHQYSNHGKITKVSKLYMVDVIGTEVYKILS